MQFIDKDLVSSSSIPGRVMASFYQAAGDNGHETVNDLDKLGTAIIFDKSLDISEAQSNSSGVTSFKVNNDGDIYTAIFVPKAKGQLKVTTDKGTVFVETNSIRAIKVNTKGFKGEEALISGVTYSKAPASLKAWLETGQRGSSSEYMSNVLFGLPEKEPGTYSDPSEYNFPHDDDDFSRCHAFLEAVPEARERLSEIAETGPEWAGLIAEWGLLARLLKQEQYIAVHSLIDDIKKTAVAGSDSVTPVNNREDIVLGKFELEDRDPELDASSPHDVTVTQEATGLTVMVTNEAGEQTSVYIEIDDGIPTIRISTDPGNDNDVHIHAGSDEVFVEAEHGSKTMTLDASRKLNKEASEREEVGTAPR